MIISTIKKLWNIISIQCPQSIFHYSRMRISVCVYPYAYIRMRISVCVYPYAYIRMRISVCVYSYAYIRMRISVCVYPYAYIRMRISVCVYPYAYIRVRIRHVCVFFICVLNFFHSFVILMHKQNIHISIRAHTGNYAYGNTHTYTHT